MISVWLSGMGVSALIVGFVTNVLKYLIGKYINPNTVAFDWATRVAAAIVATVSNVLAYFATTTSPSFSGVWQIVIAAIASTGIAVAQHHVAKGVNSNLHGSN